MSKSEGSIIVNPETGEMILVESTENKEVVEETGKEKAKKAMSRYSEINLEISKVEIEKAELIEKNKAIFEAMEALEEKQSQFVEEQNKVKDELKQIMRENNLPDFDYNNFVAKYTASYTKKNFNTKAFYEDYKPDSAMYKKYVGETQVIDSIKITEKKGK